MTKIEKAVILFKAMLNISNDETMNISRAIHLSIATEKSYDYSKIQNEWGLLEHKPEKFDSSEFWFDFNRKGQEKRIVLLLKIVLEIKF